MTCKIVEENGTVRIECSRGPISKMKLIVEDKQGNQWFVQDDKYKFDIFPEMRSIDVYDDNGRFAKKFVKKFLKIVKEL